MTSRCAMALAVFALAAFSQTPLARESRKFEAVMLRLEDPNTKVDYTLNGPAWLDSQHYDFSTKVEGDALLTKAS